MNNLTGVFQKIPRTIDCRSRIYPKECFDKALKELDKQYDQRILRKQRRKKLEKIIWNEMNN